MILEIWKQENEKKSEKRTNYINDRNIGRFGGGRWWFIFNIKIVVFYFFQKIMVFGFNGRVTVLNIRGRCLYILEDFRRG
jgi:hypothetical protein